MPINFIQGFRDVRNDPLIQGVGQAAQQVGQAYSGKTLKSMFQDVIDAGGSPITAMQKIMPFDPELAAKLGDAESKKIGNQFLKEYISKELGINIPENVDAATAAGAAQIHIGQLQREAQKAQQQQQLALDWYKTLNPTPKSPTIKVTPSTNYPSGFAYTDILSGKELAEAPKPTSLVSITQEKPPSAAERQTLAGARSTRDLLNDLQGMFNARFVGPAAGRVGTVKDLFGMNSQEQSQFYAAEKTLTNKIIKLITGAQMSEKEATRIKGEIPQPNDPPTVWQAKWEQSMKNIDYLERQTQEVIRQSGLKVPESKTNVTVRNMSDDELERALRGE